MKRNILLVFIVALVVFAVMADTQKVRKMLVYEDSEVVNDVNASSIDSIKFANMGESFDLNLLSSDSLIYRIAIANVDSIKFDLQEVQYYRVSVVSGDSVMGVVLGSGDYELNSEVLVSAVPNNGFYFSNWSDGVLDMNRTITVVSDTAVVANFYKWEYSATTIAGHEAVDLGLPSGRMWATVNVGAELPTDSGNYYAWGEIIGKQEYSWSNYLYGEELSKYNDRDKQYLLLSEDDAVSVAFGGKWSMPTKSDYQELLDNCKTEWVVINGIGGRKVVGDNGNFIFLPAGGYRDGTDIVKENCGSYWSSSLYIEESANANVLSFDNLGMQASKGCRRYGMPVRAVTPMMYKLKVGVNDTVMGFVSGGGEFEEGDLVSLHAVAKNGYRFYKWSDGVEENPRTFVVESDLSITAYFIMDQSGVYDGHAAVDLGLPSGVLWATVNVGAVTTTDSGDHFAWGETEPKNNYDLDSYRHGNKTVFQFTKYCTDRQWGIVDNKTVLDPEDDAATVNWGGDWRMPTIEEQNELINYCTIEWTSDGNMRGCKITGLNGNSIFLPAAGYRTGNQLVQNNLFVAGKLGYYWTASLVPEKPYDGWLIYFEGSNYMVYSADRYFGYSVRAVYGKRR